MVGVGVMDGVSVIVGVFVTVGVEVAVRVAVDVGMSVGVEEGVAVGGTGLGISVGLAAALRLQALRTAIPAISAQGMGLDKRSRNLGMAYRESVGQPKSRSNVPKVA